MPRHLGIHSKPHTFKEAVRGEGGLSPELCQLRQLRQVGRDAFDLIRVHRHDRDLRQELDVRGDHPQIVSVDVHPCDVGRVLDFCRTRRSMRQHTSANASIRQHNVSITSAYVTPSYVSKRHLQATQPSRSC